MRRRALPFGGEIALPSALPSLARVTPEEGEGRRYRLEERLGSGGTAEVWRATDLAGHRPVALKLLRSDLAAQTRARELLEHEARVLAALEHPNIVRSHGLASVGTRQALVLECLDGGDMVSLLGAPPRHWLNAARQIAAALAHLHERGYVHRDVKPRNVLFDRDDRAHLIDFASAVPIGTPRPSGGTTAGYGPAQVAGEPVGPEDDVLALAGLLHELLTGRLSGGARPDAAMPCHGALEEPLDALAALVRSVLEPRSPEPPPGLSVFIDVIEFATAAAA